MQISTKISTQVILSQNELKEAAIEFVKNRTDVPADAKFEVDFADDERADLTAIIDISGTMLPTANDKPSTGRTRAPKADKPATTTTQTAPPPAETPVETPPETPVVTEETTPATPEQTGDVSDSPLPDDEKVVETTKQVIPATTSPIGRIFPDIKTSAPPVKEEEDAGDKVKSLFANFTKPTN